MPETLNPLVSKIVTLFCNGCDLRDDMRCPAISTSSSLLLHPDVFRNLRMWRDKGCSDRVVDDESLPTTETKLEVYQRGNITITSFIQASELSRREDLEI